MVMSHMVILTSNAFTSDHLFNVLISILIVFLCKECFTYINLIKSMLKLADSLYIDSKIILTCPHYLHKFVKFCFKVYKIHPEFQRIFYLDKFNKINVKICRQSIYCFQNYFYMTKLFKFCCNVNKIN